MNYIFKNPTKIGVYVQTSSLKTISTVKQQLNSDVICNFQMFNMNTGAASFVLKVNGKVLGNDGSNYYGYAWNNNDRTLTFTTASQMGKYDNFAGCICVVKDGKVTNMKVNVDYPAALGGVRGRTCIGTKADGSIVIYCWPDGSSGACTMEKLGQKMVDLGCVNAVNYDGGGSTQIICPDGKVTTSRGIYNFLYFYLDEKTSQSDCPYPEPTRVIKKNSKGSDAAWVQWHLNKKNNAGLDVDGIFGAKSVTALKAFQRQANLVVDGQCGAKTIAALKGQIVSSNPSGSTSTSTAPAPSTSKYPEPTRILRVGSRGADVSWLQSKLNEHGANLQVDGDFGAKTKAALQSFQLKNGLVADGVYGSLSHAKMVGNVSASQDKTLKKKREEMLDIIEDYVGGLYVYGAQGQDANNDIIDWSAKYFPGYTTPERVARMKKYIKTHKKLKAADCSGLFWAAENIVELPFTSGDVDDGTAADLYNKYCVSISKSQLQPLDLVFNANLTHVGIVGRNGRIYEAAGSDVGIVVNKDVESRIVTSIYGEKYGCAKQYQKEPWTRFGRLKIYKNIPY